MSRYFIDCRDYPSKDVNCTVALSAYSCSLHLGLVGKTRRQQLQVNVLAMMFLRNTIPRVIITSKKIQKATLKGLSTDHKMGKFPLAGLVWSVPCPNTCPVVSGNTGTSVDQAKAIGVIVWLYLNLKGDFGVDGSVSGEDLSGMIIDLPAYRFIGMATSSYKIKSFYSCSKKVALFL